MGSDFLYEQLPVLDFSNERLKPDTDNWLATSKNVLQALEQYGCFIAVYDHVSPELRNQIFSSLEELFDLPIETKMKNVYEKPLNGYVGQLRSLPLHESLGIDDATNLEGVQRFTNLMWPCGNDHFCGSLYSFAKIAEEIDKMVTKMIYESYGVEKKYESYSESISYLLRMIKNRAPESDEPTLGFVEHTDKSFTTILYQDHINALEIHTKDGHWINVKLSPSNFVVFAGDALKAWSNDRIEAPAHRVVMSGSEARYTLGLFSFSNGTVQVPEELVDEEHPLKYKPFSHLGFLRFYRTDIKGEKYKCPIKSYCGASPDL